MKVKSYVYPLIIFTIVFILGLTNYIPNTYLSGWDNLHPEFNLSANIKRSIFAVWQEYQGLGLLGGMGHAADLPRQIFLWLAAFVLPVSFLRYFYHFLMLFIGPLGVYFLLKDSNRKEVGLIGAIFYLFNLATLQMFYVPFEVFSHHYGFLPWLFYAQIRLLKKPDRRNLLVFLVINLLAVSQGYTATVFLVYIVALSILNLSYFLLTRNSLRTILLSYFMVFCINAFWLLPNIYFALNKTEVTLSAKMNQMSTEDVFLRNKKYGDFANTAILKGFWLDSVEMDKDGINRYQMEEWRKHLDNPLVLAIGYSLFAVVVVGIFYTLKKKKIEALIFLPVLLFSYTILSNDTPGFSFLSSLFYRIPLFSQIFRFTFTKLSILAAFSFSIFFAIGSFALINTTKKKIINEVIFLTLVSLPIIFLAPVFNGKLFYQKEKAEIPHEYFQVFDYFKKQEKGSRIANFPQFTFWGWNFYKWNYSGSGFLWYGVEQPILDRAFDVWSREDENYYWELSDSLYSSNMKKFENVLEKYQINWLLVDDSVLTYSSAKALYLDQLDNILTHSPKITLEEAFGKVKIYRVNLDNKPDNFVFLTQDLPVVGPEYKWNNYDRAFEENGNYITNQQKIPFVRDSLTDMHSGASESDLSSSTISYNSNPVNSGVDLRGVEPLQSDLTDQIPHRRRPTQDQVYQDNQGATNQVFAADSSVPSVSLPLIYYPFRSLFTGRKQEELEFGVEDTRLRQGFGGQGGEYFSFTTKIPSDLVGGKLVLPELSKDEVTEYDANDLKVTTEKMPEIYLDGELVEVGPPERSDLLREISLPYIREGNLEVRVPKIKGYYSADIESGIRNQELRSCDQFNKGVYKHDLVSRGPTSGQMLRLTSIGSSNCLDFDLPNLTQRLGYLITVENRNVEGKSLLFAVINKNSQRADLETYLPRRSLSEGGQPTTSYFIQPPMEQFGVGYTLHLDNISIGRVKTENDLGRITVNPIPYKFLTSLKIVTNPSTFKGPTLKGDIKVDHPNPSFYEVKIPTTYNLQPTTTLVLSQSFDEGWRAYQIFNFQFSIFNYLNKIFPFIFGQEIKEHVLVNNWENGWRLGNQLSVVSSQKNQKPDTRNQTTIVIVYIPQYLEYIGFGLLLLTPLLLVGKRKFV